MPEHRGDGRERHAGGDGGGTEAVAQPSGARLRAFDADVAHEGAALTARALAGDVPQSRRSTLRARLGAPDAVDELEGAWTRSSGTGTALQWLARRLSVAIWSSAAARSTPQARMASASLTRHPVMARVRASVCTVGLGWTRAAARKRVRSSVVRYFRPRATTSETSALNLGPVTAGDDAKEYRHRGRADREDAEGRTAHASPAPPARTRGCAPLEPSCGSWTRSPRPAGSSSVPTRAR